ncbi:CDP-diacylglycerol-glycerol-3-phosphate3-phosphatidyltransferase Pgs1 [Schizosaccharomyces pombe]|uniref:CDP-diacylglycerol--glycerol-3-phosphate 3-phosphatidyltransferase n=1 Tax=Schizosaccharomyces pombe (strain 972 / ATCC 24843) TaxID=284812 RepID=PGPS1_SCHPO|nr:putative CDP-diacylglycerol--glycerol-3-phosphate 3-phosphatidyltransferase [Schizosaccharomyces pombe]Q9HDW1.2 RecName: Full=CDP-diacylglycerol--glycerol-3-phosphate 3-phosphatidyltransferase; AltName: Full=Phosphatidylglycerophosphate synthase; Short=PGP synthase [Schizosaccharomyces pombe 972h-]CAC21490.2 CDP-diacylglycerol-glycerol-3-phosphate3-phosphatidyltransferase (predicted) [Schizosaccharomyces pombe]|eukprot:NP_595992.2 putative CDP-diacylglycerol--glycerol-3-phosphate 3-phosphatidyltransferase [Schizosaccharomyces pombe]
MDEGIEKNIFVNLESQIDGVCPKFYVNVDDIDIIHEPPEFYQRLKKLIKKAQKRIFLSTLYIGKEERELINCLSNALSNNPSLHVHILADQLRCTRESPGCCSASLLMQLKKKFPDRCEIKLYHTPNLRGLRKQLVPHRFNEGWGLQHMKIYGADDNLIISGANLSRDYFTNRKDRYYLFSDKGLADFFFKTHFLFSQLSFECIPHLSDSSIQLSSTSPVIPFTLKWNNSCPNPLTNPQEFRVAASAKIQQLLQGNREKFLSRNPSKPLSSVYGSELINQAGDDNNKPFHKYEESAIVYPLFQCVPILTSDVHSTEEKVLSIIGTLLSRKEVNWTLTAGYFNVYPALRKQLLKSEGIGEVIVASQQANGFYRSPGPSKLIPPAYQYIAEQFLKDSRKKKRNIDVLQWQNKGNTYHAKGFWLSTQHHKHPFLTTIGSSNYTSRSQQLDLESTLVVMTQNEKLKRKFSTEIELIKQHTKPMNTCQLEKVPMYVKALTSLMKKKL